MALMLPYQNVVVASQLQQLGNTEFRPDEDADILNKN